MRINRVCILASKLSYLIHCEVLNVKEIIIEGFVLLGMTAYFKHDCIIKSFSPVINLMSHIVIALCSMCKVKYVLDYIHSTILNSFLMSSRKASI